MRVLTGIVLAAGLAAFGGAQADIYRWVDDQGGVHYTEAPPPAGNRDRGTKVRTYGAPAGGAEQGHARSQAIQSQLKEIATKRQQTAENLGKQEAEKARRTANCQAARTNLTNLENRTHRRLIDSKGNVTALSEEDRLRRMEEARKQIEENCD